MRDGECNRRAIPAKGDFERVDEHGRHGGDPGRHHHGEAGHGEDHPGIMEPGGARLVHRGHSLCNGPYFHGSNNLEVDRSVIEGHKKTIHRSAGLPCNTPSNIMVMNRRSGAGLLLTLARRSAPSKLVR